MPTARAFRECRSHFFPKSRNSTALQTLSRREEFHAPATPTFSVPCSPPIRPASSQRAPLSTAFSYVCASPIPSSPVFSCVCAIKGGRGSMPPLFSKRVALSRCLPLLASLVTRTSSLITPHSCHLTPLSPSSLYVPNGFLESRGSLTLASRHSPLPPIRGILASFVSQGEPG